MKKSARYSYITIPINSDTQNIEAADKEDGYNRMRLGIDRECKRSSK
nr:hypothetical protein [Rickettsia conorii]